MYSSKFILYIKCFLNFFTSFFLKYFFYEGKFQKVNKIFSLNFYNYPLFGTVQKGIVIILNGMAVMLYSILWKYFLCYMNGLLDQTHYNVLLFFITFKDYDHICIWKTVDNLIKSGSVNSGLGKWWSGKCMHCYQGLTYIRSWGQLPPSTFTPLSPLYSFLPLIFLFYFT